MVESKKESKREPNIYESLCRFQSQLTTVEKNRQGSNYKYADLSDIWKMIRKPLADNGFSLVQLVQTEENRNYIITKLFHISGECIESKTLIDFNAKKFQDVGASISYYRRYSLSAMLGIVSDEDIDTDGKEDNFEKNDEKFITPKQLAEIKELINGYDDILYRMKKHYKTLEKIPAADYEIVVKSINKLIEDKEAKNENN